MFVASCYVVLRENGVILILLIQSTRSLTSLLLVVVVVVVGRMPLLLLSLFTMLYRPHLQHSMPSNNNSDNYSNNNNNNSEQHPLTQPSDENPPQTATADNHSKMGADSSSTKKDQLFRLFLLFLMTAQNSSVVLLSRYSRAGISKADLYVINDVLMVTEIAKVSFALVLFGLCASIAEYEHTCQMHPLYSPPNSTTTARLRSSPRTKRHQRTTPPLHQRKHFRPSNGLSTHHHPLPIVSHSKLSPLRGNFQLDRAHVSSDISV